MSGPMAAASKPSSRAVPEELVAYIDGGSRGNPGPAGYGVLIQDAQGQTLETLSQFLGTATNNVAEYQGLLAALEYAAQRQSKRLKVYCDSELIVRQMQGSYRVQSPDLKPLHQRAQELARRLPQFSIEHVPREQNRQADRLANQAMDRGESPARSIQTFLAIAESGKLRPLAPLPHLVEGEEYEVRARKRSERSRDGLSV